MIKLKRKNQIIYEITVFTDLNWEIENLGVGVGVGVGVVYTRVIIIINVYKSRVYIKDV